MTSIIPSSDVITRVIPATYSGVTANIYIQRSKNVCDLRIEIGNGTAAFSSATGTDIIFELPSDWIPSYRKEGTLVARTGGNWATETYYIAAVAIETTGNVYIRGNANNLKQCRYITGDLMYLL